jgi:hypothetical protein
MKRKEKTLQMGQLFKIFSISVKAWDLDETRRALNELSEIEKTISKTVSCARFAPTLRNRACEFLTGLEELPGIAKLLPCSKTASKRLSRLVR